MTDNEIIKALECCTDYSYESLLCRECPYFEYGFNRRCRDELSEDSLALISRQKAEIEALKLINSTYVATTEEIREIAIKEFAERLKEKAITFYTIIGRWISVKDIDNLVKEMEGEHEVS